MVDADRLRDSLTSIYEDSGTGALLVTSEDFSDYSTATVRTLVSDLGLQGVYVAVNRPTETVMDALDVDTGRLFFIDAVTIPAGGEPGTEDNVVYLDSPEDLSSLLITIRTTLSALGAETDDRPFLFIDAICALNVYNPTEDVCSFLQQMTRTVYSEGAVGVVMARPSEADVEVVDRIRQVVDTVVELNGD